MTKNSQKIFYIIIFFLINKSGYAQQRSEIPDPDALGAYQKYWQTFDDYESHYMALEKGRFLGSWEQIKHEWNYQDLKQTKKQLDLLKEASQRYYEHLERFPDASNSSYVKLNLAQILNKIGQLENERDAGAGLDNKKEALSVLSKIKREWIKHELFEESLYLRATILEEMDQSESAKLIWQKLANEATSTIYGVHALIAMGDSSFIKEQPKDALKYFNNAKILLEKIRPNDYDYELLRVQYRAFWAAYRAADLNYCITIAQEVLEPGRRFKQNSIRIKIIQDATDLIADALFEKDNFELTKEALKKSVIKPYAGAIGFRIMTNLSSFPTPNRMVELGEFLVDYTPQSSEIPDILTLLADNYRKQKKDDNYISILERLALMLPSKSLWRNQHQDEEQVVKKMVERSLAANKLLAAHYYEQGMVQGNIAYFQSAYSYYQTLITYSPLSEEAEIWQLRSANSLYFAGRWDEADSAYETVINRGKIDPSRLEVASYQQTLSREKLWRQSLQKTHSLKGEPHKNPLTVEKLRKLEESIDSFADRFPNRPHSVDLLLLAASANRDINNYIRAEQYWNRALLSEPSPTQRTLAIRGLVQSKVQSQDPKEILEITRNYLKLEEWRELSPIFANEMLGILSIAAKDYSELLNKQGKIEEAGQTLLSLTHEFPDMPDSETLYRDGSYFLALAGSWNEALKAADIYLKSDMRKKEADLTYLKAKALEYQMQFSESAKVYISLGERFPNYKKSRNSLERAEQLALAEDDYQLAGQAALALLPYQKDKSSKLLIYQRSAQYFITNRSWDDAMISLKNAEKISNNQGQKLQAKLLIGKALASQGDSNQALSLYDEIIKENMSKRERLDPSIFKSVMGEANFLLADFENQNFTKIKLDVKKSQFDPKFIQKSLHLEKALEHYNNAIQTESPEWSTRSRYAAGEILEQMSLELKNFVAKSDFELKSKERLRLEKQSIGWAALSKEYFGQNLLVRNRAPDQFRDSIWIERSALKFSGKIKPKNILDPESEVPASIISSQPFQWSY